MTNDETLEVNVTVDSKNKVLIIQDNGIGMTDKELITNLGRIGHSGSAEFLKQLTTTKDTASIIGQFGVGFYSAFMVSSKITAYSKSYAPDAKGYCWVSDGTGSYEISEAEGVSRGTKIILQLNPESLQFAEPEEVESTCLSSSDIFRYYQEIFQLCGVPYQVEQQAGEYDQSLMDHAQRSNHREGSL